MSVWGPRRKKPEARAAGQSIWQPTFPFTYGQVGRTYEAIDPTQGEASLQSVAFSSGCDLIASIVSELPLAVYSGIGSKRKLRTTPGYLEDPAGDGHGRPDWVYQWIMSWLLRGNSFGNVIDQGPTGMKRQVDVLHPDTVSVSVIEGRPSWHVSGVEIPTDRFYHKRVNQVPGTLMGRSMVQSTADALGLSIATTRFGRGWFEDGGTPSGILKNELSDLGGSTDLRTVKDRFVAAMFGTREPLVLGRGWSYESVQVAPEESQFLETQGWSEAQCARILGAGVAEVLGYDTGSSMTYANVVDRDVSLLKYAVGRWVNRIERVFFDWLPRPQYVVLDRDAFLETSAAARWRINTAKLVSGAYTINMIREDENDPPVPWGDEPFVLPTAPAADPGAGDPAGGEPGDPGQPGPNQPPGNGAGA